ncbi:MAG: pyruvate dehydrogenase component alpha subunit [Blastocatellia bacterium]|nr:pyruvate dehydrogenase component alpha subunit [Blastocatellia bacterium]
MSSQTTERTDKPNPSAGSAAGVLDSAAEAQTKIVRPNPSIEEDRDTLLKIFYQMVLIRRFEEKCAESYSLGKIGGFCHLYIGQEAVGVGSISALREDDYVITSYREHGQAIAKGISPEAVMAELYGKAGGCSHGKGGSMHLFDKRVNFLGGHGIVGGQIPLATGVAFASKYKETDQVTLCFFGEAAVNQGAFHESMNMAQLWKLPCIYICENNQYGMGTSLARAMSLQNVSQKAAGYEMESEFVDGMDVLAMRRATQRAIKRARESHLPTLIEARTYRYMGHSMSDPGNYRTRAEIEKHQERDPIKLFTVDLKENGFLTDKDIADIEARVKEEVESSVKFAEESPEPDPSELYTNVYANPIEN